MGDAEGRPLAPDEAAIDALFDLWPIYEAFNDRFLARWLLLGDEGNGSAPADWHFGGGAGYCAACPGPCPDCPARLNQPRTVEGWQVWDLAQRLGGQMRVIPGAVVGLDMVAAFAMARALGVDEGLVAELLPGIEAVMVRRMNEQVKGGRGDG